MSIQLVSISLAYLYRIALNAAVDRKGCCYFVDKLGKKLLGICHTQHLDATLYLCKTTEDARWTALNIIFLLDCLK
jgi:hypothetical protein